VASKEDGREMIAVFIAAAAVLVIAALKRNRRKKSAGFPASRKIWKK
jgi:hypothetical protein